MADPVRIGGFFSSFDTEAVIQQLTLAREGVLRQLDIKSTTITAKRTTLGTVQSKFAALLAKINALVAPASVGAKSTQVTGTGVTAAATPSSTLGTFTVDVTKLASSTTHAGTAISTAIDAASPMNLANFGVIPTNGTFTIATATGGTRTFYVGGAAVQSASLLNASNFATAPASGTFTITTATGGSVQLTVDVATQTLDDVITAINATAIGVTASISADASGKMNQITLTSTQGAITLGNGTDTSNFLTATNLLSSSGTTTRVSSTAFTKQASLNEVIADINAGGIGVTASVTNDANGKANILTLTSTQGDISLGNGGDTSNFLTATNVIASAAGTTRASTQSMARLSLSAKLNVAGLDGGAPAAGDHSFTLNGATINYNVANDSLTDIINRINASAAGVTARYDSAADTIRLQNNKTGSLTITVADDGAGGNLMAKLGLLAGTQTLGGNAEYKIDGGATQTSATNTVSTASGVTLTFSALTGATPATVTVTQDVNTALTTVKGFITEFNSVMTAIDAATKADGSKTNNQSGVLSGDATLRQLKSDLRNIVTGAGINVGGNFVTLGQIGFNWGAVGAAVGTTNTLQLDETKFKNALANDPASVQAVLNALTLTASLVPGGTGSITGMTGTYSGAEGGTYAISDDGAGNLTSVFTPANGGPKVTQTATVTAGGTNTSLIPGMTLSIAGVFQAGSHSITVSATSQSVIRRLKDFADVAAGAGGVLQKRQDAFAEVTKDIAQRRSVIEERISREMDGLRRKFAAMERAQARAQAVQSALEQALTRMDSASRQQ